MAGGIALVFAGLLTFAGCEHSNAKAARAERDAMEAARDYAVDANLGKDQVIEDLTTSRDRWKLLATPSEEMEAAAARAGELEVELTRTRAKLDKLAEEKDRANPDCLAVLEVDFERACPHVAERLRNRASGDQDLFR